MPILTYRPAARAGILHILRLEECAEAVDTPRPPTPQASQCRAPIACPTLSTCIAESRHRASRSWHSSRYVICTSPAMPPTMTDIGVMIEPVAAAMPGHCRLCDGECSAADTSAARLPRRFGLDYFYFARKNMKRRGVRHMTSGRLSLLAAPTAPPRRQARDDAMYASSIAHDMNFTMPAQVSAAAKPATACSGRNCRRNTPVIAGGQMSYRRYRSRCYADATFS